MPRFGSQVDLQRIPLKGVVPESSTSAPANPVDGLLWHDATENRVKYYRAGSWEYADQIGVELVSRKGAANGYPSLDANTKVPFAQLPTGTTASTVAVGNDSRFTNSRTPSGSAGGDLAGTYPNPTVALLAITDAKVATANKDGAAGVPSMRTIGTGALQALAGNTRLDQLAAPTASVALNGQRITGLGTPVAGTDSVTKDYADGLRAGLRIKDAVRVATTVNITLSGTQTIDGVAVAAGDRVLVKNQTTASANGIYVVATGAWTRASDADEAAELTDGATTFVAQGTAQADTTWAQTAALASFSSNQTWVQQGAAASYTAGAGLQQNGNVFDVVAADGSIVVAADSITLGLAPIAKGGTNATTAAEARTNLGAVGKYAVDLGALTAGSEATITHSLGTTDVTVVFRATGDGYREELDWRVINANSIGVTSHVAYASGALRVVVTG